MIQEHLCPSAPVQNPIILALRVPDSFIKLILFSISQTEVEDEPTVCAFDQIITSLGDETQQNEPFYTYLLCPAYSCQLSLQSNVKVTGDPLRPH